MVRGHYADLTNLAMVHPLIVSVDLIGDTAGDDGSRRTYRIKDLVPMGLLKLPIVYTAVMVVPASGPVTSQAFQFPRIRLDSEVSFEPVAGGTRLTERIRISAPGPLLGLTVRRAVAAHTEMLAGLRRHFGG